MLSCRLSSSFGSPSTNGRSLLRARATSRSIPPAAVEDRLIEKLPCGYRQNPWYHLGMASADQQAARNRGIIIAKASGEETAAIAAKHGISTARVRQILAAGTVELIEAKGPDPVHAALERRAQYEEIYEKANALFDEIPDSNPSPKVGALRLGLLALDRLSAWDQSVGIIPTAPSWVSQEAHLRSYATALIDALERVGFPIEKLDEVLEAMETFDSEWSETPEIEPPS